MDLEGKLQLPLFGIVCLAFFLFVSPGVFLVPDQLLDRYKALCGAILRVCVSCPSLGRRIGPRFLMIFVPGLRAGYEMTLVLLSVKKIVLLRAMPRGQKLRCIVSHVIRLAFAHCYLG